uniref:Tubulin delta chain n=1 Tax=Phallusia mammillata TaxID=59560 RepID=A0A6F9DVB9_9ASCI|nr:UNI3 delta-tubulin [Phallusia mammillata]
MKTFFNDTQCGKHEARSVMIDMEPKAVNWAVQDTTGKEWRYAKSQQFVQKSGSGNNWSYGFKVHAPKCKDAIIDLIRKEIEKCDYFGGFLLLMSLAGGTGSGLGAFVGNVLRDNFPRATVLNPVVCPYTSGEVAVQNYNAVLSLSHIIAVSDAVCLLHNNQLHEICHRLLGIKQVSFHDMNKVAAHQLASVLLPIIQDKQSGSRFQNVLNDIASALVCNSRYKMLDLKCVPYMSPHTMAFNTFQWEGLAKRMFQMMLTDHHMDEGLNWRTTLTRPHGKTQRSSTYTKYVSSLLFMRGQGSTSYDLLTQFGDSRLYPTWIMPACRNSVWKTELPFRGYEKCIAFLSNGTSCVKSLNVLTEEAWDMFGSKAYLHHYYKYGLEESDFINAFATVENVIYSYKTL